MRILILGGSGFIGPAIVDEARARGHELTLFNRGKTQPALARAVEVIAGDRATEMHKLKGRGWDAVIDTWAREPALVRGAAEALREHARQYVFVSTISVYRLTRAPLDEGSETLTLPAGVSADDLETVDEKVYGPLKALAERAAEEAMPGRVTVVRPGVIAGRGDVSARFTYWARRVARGGAMIVPGASSDPLQLIDVRDLAAFLVRVVEQRDFGVYNAVGPAEASIGAVLEAVKRGVGGDARFTFVDYAWLKAQGADGWGSFPLALDPGGEEAGFAQVSSARAIARGLTFRSPADTARDALAWWRAQPDEVRARAPGITGEREAELLRRYVA